MQHPGSSHPTQSTSSLPQQPQTTVSHFSQAGPSQPARPTPPLPHKARHAVPKKKRQDLADLIDMDVEKSTTNATTVAPSIKPEDTPHDLHHPSVTPERFRNESADLQHPSVTPERFRNASAELQPLSVTLERQGDTSVQLHPPSQTPELTRHASVESVQISNAPRNLSVPPGPILNITTDALTLSDVSTGAAHSEDIEFQHQFLVKDDDMEVDSSPADDLPSHQDLHQDKEPLPPPIVFSDGILLVTQLKPYNDQVLSCRSFRPYCSWDISGSRTERAYRYHSQRRTIQRYRCLERAVRSDKVCRFFVVSEIRSSVLS